MQKKWPYFKTICIAVDFCLILISYYAAFSLRHDVLGGAVTIDARGNGFVYVSIVYAAMLVLSFYLMHLYELPQVMKGTGNIARIVLGATMGIVLLTAALFSVKLVHISRLALAMVWLFEILLVTLRWLLTRKIIYGLIRTGAYQEHYILVGNGRLAKQYLQDLAREPYSGVVVDGYVSKVQKPELGKCLGSYEELESIVASLNPDGLVVALEPHEIRFMKYVMDTAGKEGIYLRMIPFYNDYYPARPTFELVGKTKLINLRATPLDKAGNALMKRLMDIVGSLLLIILSSPVMLAVAIGVRLSGSGSVIFRQERVGRNKKPFIMHKFRSMYDNTAHDAWTVQNDARRTRFGRFIRKYSLDELPQLFDVLVGNMSLVGPRPELPRYVRQFKRDVPLYLVRQQVRPGMTGWAQIHGLRGDTSIEKRVEYDIWYIENWSLMLDIRILLRTAFGGFKNNE